MGVHKEWKEEASKQTMETIDTFIKHIVNDYEHDYGTIVHAMAAGMLATFSAIDKSDQGGITGFQASCLMWEMVRKFGGLNKNAPARLVDMENLLFPQFEDRFTTISKSTAEWIKEEAKKKLAENSEHAHPDVIKHWEKIATGWIPFGLVLSKED